MKRFMFLLCLSLIFVLGCKNENTNPNSFKDISLLHSATGISNVGTDHNEALALCVLDTTVSYTDTTESIRFLNWTISCIKSINPTYDSISMYQNGINTAYYLAGKNIDTIYTAYVNANLPLLLPNLSNVEYDLLNRGMDFLTNYNFAALSPSQSYSLIIRKADSLLVEYNAIDWDTVSTATYNKGELAGGFLNIMKSSAVYWNVHQPSAPTPESFIVFDAWGYVFFWGHAVASEISQNGKLDIKNSNRRINEGLTGAVAASTGYFLK